jgi:alpha-tubulin suppressor-like RCC1 family protein
VHITHSLRRGEYGRLGIADRTGSSKLRPQKVRGLEGHTVAQVAAGGTHSLAVTSAGRMFIWGRGSYGRLGLGAGAKDAYAPVEAALPGGHERWRIAAATAGE